MKKIFLMLFLIIILLTIIFFIFFNNKVANNMKIGNNSTSQEIIDYILNISSYETKAEIEIKSNKNTNKYILKQQYIDPDICVQEVIEPTNIAGTRIIKKGNTIKLENTNLNLNSVFQDYEYISDNVPDLSSFIENYKNNEKSSYEEKDNEIIMNTINMKSNQYAKNETLYIDKNTGLPIEMEIKDANKKTIIDIKYIEVNINSLKEENIIAFKINNLMKKI